jgi:serine/threonine-protein kinase
LRSSLPPAGAVPAIASNPESPTARPPARNLPEVSSDWDDEQEKTTVYDRTTQDAASALLRGSSSAFDVPPPPMSRPPAAPPAPVRAHAPAAAQLMSPTPVAALPVKLPPPAPSRAPLYIMAAAVVVLGAVLGLLLRPAKGSLIVTVSGVGSRPIDAVEVLVDGDVVCSASPCRVDLKAGTHLVQARAAGHQPAAEIAIVISGGQEAVHNVTLARTGGTGIKITALGAGLKLYVDGNEIGPLPQELPDMAPGEHTIRVAGNDRYAPYEQRINVQVGQMETIGPLSLRVIKGLATIQAGSGAAEAKITLESGSDRRTLPELPVRLDIPTDRDHTLVAMRRGYSTYREKLVFEDGAAEKVFVVSLTKIGEEAAAMPTEPEPPSAQQPSTPTAPASPPPARTPTAPSEPKAPPAAATPSGTATLNINSIPRSNVLLDGKPIGQTPKIGVTVSAGTHTVVFIKDDERKTSTITVPEGGNKTVAVRF